MQGAALLPGPCSAAQASPSPRRGAGMPFPTSTILLLCFFLACFVLSPHKLWPRVSVNSFQVPVSRRPAAPLSWPPQPRPRCLQEGSAPPLLTSPGAAPRGLGTALCPQPGKNRPAECRGFCPHLSVWLSHEVKEIWVQRELPSHPQQRGCGHGAAGSGGAW